jgi:hypothetical protein
MGRDGRQSSSRAAPCIRHRERLRLGVGWAGERSRRPTCDEIRTGGAVSSRVRRACETAEKRLIHCATFRERAAARTPLGFCRNSRKAPRSPGWLSARGETAWPLDSVGPPNEQLGVGILIPSGGFAPAAGATAVASLIWPALQRRNRRSQREARTIGDSNRRRQGARA